MRQVEQFFVVPFRYVYGRIEPGEAQRVRAEQEAYELAAKLSARFGGALAIGAVLDSITGEVLNSREILRRGLLPDEIDQAAA